MEILNYMMYMYLMPEDSHSTQSEIGEGEWSFNIREGGGENLVSKGVEAKSFNPLAAHRN